MSHYPDCIVEGDSLKSYTTITYKQRTISIKWTKRVLQHGAPISLTKSGRAS